MTQMTQPGIYDPRESLATAAAVQDNCEASHEINAIFTPLICHTLPPPLATDTMTNIGRDEEINPMSIEARKQSGRMGG